MATIFEKIAQREIPAQIVYEDELSFAFLDINPVQRGHLLVVPKTPIDHFDELPAPVAAHIFLVAQKISRSLRRAFDSERCALVIAGYGVPHAHLHLFPTNSEKDIKVSPTLDVSAAELAADAEKIRAALA